MAPTVEEPVKRGRGRPRKSDAEKAATAAAKVGKSGRPRGRPLGSKNKSTLAGGVQKKTAPPPPRATETVDGVPVKRGRGRPRKVVSEADEVATPNKKAASAVATPATGEKRGRGRPRKTPTTAGDATPADTPASTEAKRRGRPAKSATPKSSATPTGSATPAAERGASPVLDGAAADTMDEDEEPTADAKVEPLVTISRESSALSDDAPSEENGGF